MKGLLRSFIIHTIVIWLVAEYVGGINFNTPSTLFAAGFALMLADAILKPLINLFLLPCNLNNINAAQEARRENRPNECESGKTENNLSVGGEAA